MQISAANFLVAAQQGPKAAQAPAPAKTAFAPLDFKQTAAPAKAAQTHTPAQRPGSQIDITV